MSIQPSYIVWQVDPYLFSDLSFVRWYGVMWALGILMGMQVMAYIYRKEGKPKEELERLSLYIILGTVLGARLGHILFYDPWYYLANPVEILPIRIEPHFEFTGLAGLASHGGAIGLLLALYLFCTKYKTSFSWIVDRLVIIGALTGSFIRLGNLMNSEVIGTPTHVPWAFIFTRVDLIPRHPAQLYEALFYLLLFFTLFSIWKRNGFQDRNHLSLGVFLVSLFSFRFLVEFIKEDQAAFEASFALNMGQMLSIPFILLGIIVIVLSFQSKKNATTKHSQALL